MEASVAGGGLMHSRSSSPRALGCEGIGRRLPVGVALWMDGFDGWRLRLIRGGRRLAARWVWENPEVGGDKRSGGGGGMGRMGHCS